MDPLDAAAPLSSALISRITTILGSFVDAHEASVAAVGAQDLLPTARSYLMGGKRLRPAFCYWSHVAIVGTPENEASILTAAASLDVLHASALVHDDLIDGSRSRRGLASAHIAHAAAHRAAHGTGDAERFGAAAAVLLGDLLTMWSAELFDTCGCDDQALDRARPLLHATRSEVTCGQYLDVAAASQMIGEADELDVADRILEYKSARYSVRRPCQIGAALAGADDKSQALLGEFGSALGRAFQLRDDVLGVFGDPEVTGKPAGDDLREGKRTWLILTCLRDGSATEAAALDELLGRELSEAEVVRAQQIITDSGALASVEQAIERGRQQALAVLMKADFTDSGRTALQELVTLTLDRDH